MGTSFNGVTLCLMISSSIVFYSSSYAMDTINSTQGLRYGETLVSSGGMFELGFFSPGSSGNHYLGSWYRNLDVRTVLWVANRDTPIRNTTGVALTVIPPGILALINDTNGVIWSSNTSRSLQNPIGQLLDLGNLVVREANDERPENFVWQSFNYPTDTHLPGMRFGWNLATGLESYLSSWRGEDDPAPGEYSFHLDPTGFPQAFLKRGGVVRFRIGPWNGLRFSGTADTRGDPTYRATFVMNENEVSFGEILVDRSSIARFTLNLSGVVQRLIWVNRRGWAENLNMPTDICDNYRMCGENAVCNIGNSPACGCLDRFTPRDPQGWVRTDWEDGCVRRRNLSCEGDVFLRYTGIKLPDARHSWYNTSMTLRECREVCSRNCSCTAYTQLDIRRGSGCLMYGGELYDIRSLSLNGQDIYIRMASSESPDSERKKRKRLIASLTSVIGVVLIGLSLLFYIRKRKNDQKMKGGTGLSDASHHRDPSHHTDPELPSFDLSVIFTATKNFSLSNKIGEGGYGPVYKGILEGGQEIAVKRLSKDSMQGIDEFKNEVIFIAKLQHRNLVRLLGCCIQGEENMLIYEYMPNRSLDNILFDQTRRMLLDWPKRFRIINGIARGLLYLHQDSRLRIIHRDLKASNVLLDSEMNPKISDFGMARSFGGNETADKTQRVVGTYGYMAPEYAVDGLFSVKSDVFSFGVLILEIVSGKRNRGFSDGDHSLNLLGHAWTLYREGMSLELADNSIAGSFYVAEVLRSIHVGLLCVQQNPEDRPSISTVVQMLGKEGIFPEAKQPGFFTKRDIFAAQNSTSTDAARSTNEMSITLLEAR